MPRRHQLKTPVQQEHDAGLLGHVNMCPLGILILTLNAANNTVKKKKQGKLQLCVQAVLRSTSWSLFSPAYLRQEGSCICK